MTECGPSKRNSGLSILKREGEVQFQTRRGILQDPVGQFDPLDLVVEDHFLGDLRAAGAGGRYDQAPVHRAALSLSDRRVAGTLQPAVCTQRATNWFSLCGASRSTISARVPCRRRSRRPPTADRP